MLVSALGNVWGARNSETVPVAWSWGRCDAGD